MPKNMPLIAKRGGKSPEISTSAPLSDYLFSFINHNLSSISRFESNSGMFDSTTVGLFSSI